MVIDNRGDNVNGALKGAGERGESMTDDPLEITFVSFNGHCQAWKYLMVYLN